MTNKVIDGQLVLQPETQDEWLEMCKMHDNLKSSTIDSKNRTLSIPSDEAHEGKHLCDNCQDKDCWE